MILLLVTGRLLTPFRFQNPWDSNPTTSPFDAPVQSQGYDGQLPGGGSNNYMLDSAPVPPPVQKVTGAPIGHHAPPDTNGGGMEVDQPMVA